MTGRAARSAVLTGSAVVCAALIVLLTVGPLEGEDKTATNDILQGVVPLLATLPCCIGAARRTEGRRRLAWWLLAAGAASWGVGEIAWCWFEIVLDQKPFPSIADAGFLLSVPFLLGGVMAYPAGLLRMGRARVLIDGMVIVAALLFAASGSFLGSIWDLTEGTPLERALLISYPASDVLVVAAALAIVARRPAGLRGPLGLLIAGIASLAVADSAFAWFSAHGTHRDPVTDVGWPLGFLFVGWAAHRDLETTPEAADGPQPMRAATVIEAWLPQLPIGIAGVVVLYRGFRGDESRPFLGTVGLVMLLLVIARQALVQLENGELAKVLEGAVDELRAREDELEHRALHDPLTGLANRALLRDRLDHAMQRRALDDSIAVLLVDLDDFKTVNDTMGHDNGDRLLVQVANRLRACVRGEDTVARLGGDEFAVLLEEPHPAAATELGERILAALQPPFLVAGRELRARASIGIVVGEPGATSTEQLLQDADLAMYAAKATGGSRVERFVPTMRVEALDRLDLLSDLEGVLDRGGLQLHYQPMVRLATGEVAGHEALLRWQHPVRGLLAPGAFLDLAEEAGHMLAIGWWVLEEACRSTAARDTDQWVSVNLSLRQLHDPAAVDRVVAALERSGLPGRRVVLEVTERALAEGEELLARMSAIRRLGVRIAIDDFGTGYSSLAALGDLPLDALKVDGSFVGKLNTDEGRAIIRAVVDIASALDLWTVAEGIEEPWQLQEAAALGFHDVQGFLIGRPAPAPIDETHLELDALLAR